MARAIDAERLSNELKAYRQQYFGYGWHNEYAVLGQCLSLIDAQPTLTPPNEPLSCVGCDYLDEQCAPCAHCIRARRYADYYHRPPEGEEDT